MRWVETVHLLATIWTINHGIFLLRLTNTEVFSLIYSLECQKQFPENCASWFFPQTHCEPTQDSVISVHRITSMALFDWVGLFEGAVADGKKTSKLDRWLNSVLLDRLHLIVSKNRMLMKFAQTVHEVTRSTYAECTSTYEELLAARDTIDELEAASTRPLWDERRKDVYESCTAAKTQNSAKNPLFLCPMERFWCQNGQLGGRKKSYVPGSPSIV